MNIINFTTYGYDLNLNHSTFGDYIFNPTHQIIHKSYNDSLIFIPETCAGVSNPYFYTIVYLLYISIFLIALVGNGVVCLIVKLMPRMRTVTNYFIANLAVGDILMSLFCIPPSFISILILTYWPFGSIFCQLVNYSQAISVLVSAYTLVAISIDRYIAIMWPLKPRISKREAKYIIAVIWIIALITAFPIPIFSELTQPSEWHIHCNRYICTETWPEQILNYYYSLALMALQFLIPVTVMIFTYTRIAVALWGKRPPGEAENLRDRRMAKSKRRMIKMMVIVVIVFTICWLPFNILTIVNLSMDITNWNLLPYIWFAFHWLAMSHSCYNPFIYCYMKDKFREGFTQIVLRIPGIRKCYKHEPTNAMGHGMTLTVSGGDEVSQMYRTNTCTTIISTRKKTKVSLSQTPSTTETMLLR